MPPPPGPNRVKAFGIELNSKSGRSKTSNQVIFAFQNILALSICKPGADIDALEYVHFVWAWALFWRVADDIDDNVVVHFLQKKHHKSDTCL